MYTKQKGRRETKERRQVERGEPFLATRKVSPSFKLQEYEDSPSRLEEQDSTSYREGGTRGGTRVGREECRALSFVRLRLLKCSLAVSISAFPLRMSPLLAATFRLYEPCYTPNPSIWKNQRSSLVCWAPSPSLLSLLHSLTKIHRILNLLFLSYNANEPWLTS